MRRVNWVTVARARRFYPGSTWTFPLLPAAPVESLSPCHGNCIERLQITIRNRQARRDERAAGRKGEEARGQRHAKSIRVRPRSSPAAPPASASASPRRSSKAGMKVVDRRHPAGPSRRGRRRAGRRRGRTRAQARRHRPRGLCRRRRSAAEARFGKIHLLVNNAGIGVVGPIELASYGDWDWSLSVNLGGVVNGIVTILPRILSHGEGGHIVLDRLHVRPDAASGCRHIHHHQGGGDRDDARRLAW